MHLTLNSVVSRNADVIEAEIDGERVMMSIETGQYYGLDAIASRIWSLLETPQSVQAICAALISQYQVDEAQCAADVSLFLEQMIGYGVIRVVE